MKEENAMKGQTNILRMIAPDLVENSPTGTRIVAGRRKLDERLVFPLSIASDGGEFERVLLSPRGRLWSWTVQRFKPKAPPYQGPDEDPFKPFLVGFVEFPEGVIVEGRIDAKVDKDEMIIGMPMETTVMPAFTDASGETIYVHAFRVVKQDNTSQI